MRARVLAALLALGTTNGYAAIYARVDPVSGMTVLSNVPAASRATAATVPAPPPAKAVAQPGDFPRVSAQRQKQMDGNRREILETELSNEQMALDAAAASRAATDIVQRHLANVAALKRELAGVR